MRVGASHIEWFWKIRNLNGKYAMTICLDDGGSEQRKGAWQVTRAEAVADGIASGLPEWKGGK